MNLQNLEQSSFRQNFVRQNDATEEEDTANNEAELGDDEIRCIPKVMQVSDRNCLQCFFSDFEMKCRFYYN